MAELPLTERRAERAAALKELSGPVNACMCSASASESARQLIEYLEEEIGSSLNYIARVQSTLRVIISIPIDEERAMN